MQGVEGAGVGGDVGLEGAAGPGLRCRILREAEEGLWRLVPAGAVATGYGQGGSARSG